MNYDLNAYYEVGIHNDKVRRLRELADDTEDFDTEKMLRSAAAELEELRNMEEESYTLEVSEALEKMLEYDEHQKMTIVETMNERLEKPLPSPKRVLEKTIYYFDHSVSELRDFCKDLYLPVSGNKSELVYLLVNKWMSELVE